ncbi:DUF4366 domain-containing protein [Oscillibacter sp.]|uniref:DUF4366 domain-containing protein n=1 Tax=Oscillibacter sp. TaxID=1945593 RepID=UPI00289DE373|nr:DUF4366 domain-containing protein [Oscillibacter sp.]
MKNKKKRILSALLAVMLCMAAFPLTAFAGGGPECEDPIPEPAEETTGGYEPEPLTPEGNMSLVDDIEGEASGDKQFITVITKNGNYFYIIIDRAEDGENTVHFLNQVDEADLLALMEDETASAPTPPATCICTDKCKAGAVNTNCPICKNDMTNCMGKEAAAEPEPEPEKSGGMGGMLIIVLILALGGGGAYYYFKVLKPKQSVKGGSDLDDYDFEDDEKTELEVLEDEREDKV